MDIVGWIIGAAGLGYGLWSDYNSRKEKQRLHSFLKALKTGVEANNTNGVLKAINDEMERLIPPKNRRRDASQ